MIMNCWQEIFPKYFYGESAYTYNAGKVSNYLGVKVVECSKDKDQLSYGRFYDGTLVAIIMKENDKPKVLNGGIKNKYVATVRSHEGYAYDSFYSNSLEELKLKSDLYLINQGYKISFPGV